MVRAKGELEALVINTLWDHPSGMTAKEVMEAVPGRNALTTVITVLERLREKGKVTRHAEGGRSFEYSATRSRLSAATETIQEALTSAGDRQAALVLLAGSLSDDDKRLLREALGAD